MGQVNGRAEAADMAKATRFPEEEGHEMHFLTGQTAKPPPYKQRQRIPFDQANASCGNPQDDDHWQTRKSVKTAARNRRQEGGKNQ